MSRLHDHNTPSGLGLGSSLQDKGKETIDENKSRHDGYKSHNENDNDNELKHRIEEHGEDPISPHASKYSDDHKNERRMSTSLLNTPSRYESSNRRRSNDFHMESLQHFDHVPQHITLPQSPDTKNRLLPPTTPKSKQSEAFLSPSPKLKSPGVYKDSNKPIREISNSLKTRLNYALVKLQNGWEEKTLSELEGGYEDDNTHESPNGGRIPGMINSRFQRRMSSYSNQFAFDEETSVDTNGNLFKNTPTETESTTKKLEKPLKNGPNISQENQNTAAHESNESTSAHLAFLKAIMSPKKNSPVTRLTTSPLKWQEISTHKQKEPVLEEQAIETLMSLSSPKKSASSKSLTGQSPTHSQDSPATDVETDVELSDKDQI